tara:strand:+ start:105 stop:431 length:327 start_codon:yes stop_codon:yes gene_type:complete
MSETNPIADFVGEGTFHEFLETVDYNAQVYWTEPGLHVTRLRLLSDPGCPMWGVSYCFGRLNGKNVKVMLPFHDLPKRGFRKAIVEWAKEDKVYAKKLGILENISTLC